MRRLLKGAAGLVLSALLLAPVSAIAFRPHRDLVATAGEDRVVRVWDAVTHKLAHELSSHTDRVPALAWSPDGSLLISAGWDTSARVWQPPQTDPAILLNSHADQVHTLADPRHRTNPRFHGALNAAGQKARSAPSQTAL